ncbi:FMN-dependent dehydrogenase family protein [Aspergillus costaricaensis CBS 115574]|uniref:FMN-dependent dehydrogenase family protein n=1 Tax=Aspergillus costaricaensis CBS 115574 TaxID=1448317 RepID=A0ACD1IDE7_9EURO|nr:FMN-dependent dehydrogenase family protein [Aspergillus costaricaensis CBS 115574]RAK88256.1 FMN-dependent dehydrogenase family protein [Aspergillus costaricaensis CBS 115574]
MANRGKSLDSEIFSIADLQAKASEKLPREFKEFFNEGAMDLITVKDNEDAFNRYKIRPRVLRDVSNLDTSTTICNTKVSFPFGFSPAASHKIAHSDGEVGTSKVAAEANICMALSSHATCSLEDVIAEGSGNPYMIQFIILKDRDITRQLLERAESETNAFSFSSLLVLILLTSSESGYKAVMLTVDAPMLGRRLNEYRNSFGIPKGMGYPNLAPGLDMKDGIEWAEAIAWIRSVTKLDIWVKGIYTAEDVALAIQHGVNGVLISNHGGRQLDGVPATLDALRECAPVAKGKIAIAIDGGIRRGTDIFKALALGADYCFAGRIPIWGLAYNGTKGVELAVKLLQEEFKLAMCLAGCKTVKDINKSHLSVLETNGVLSKL